MTQVMQPRFRPKKKKKFSLFIHGSVSDCMSKFTIPKGAKGAIPPPDTAVIDFIERNSVPLAPKTTHYSPMSMLFTTEELLFVLVMLSK
jgi:hypothetical protein